MNIILKFILLILLGYACGIISFAKAFSKRRVNIEKSGSGNPGTMNMLRTHGATLGILTLFFDALKAFAPSILAFLLVKQSHSVDLAYIALYAVGLAAVLGHIYPITNKFKGGKGIASTFGVFLAANPAAAGIVFGACFIFFYFIKIASLSSMVYILSFGIWQTIVALLEGQYIIVILLWIIIIIDVYAHRENIKRLLSRTERITSFQEGVKKDLENIRMKKKRKLENKLHKTEMLEDKFKQKLEKRTIKLERKLNKKLNKNAKRVKRVEKRLDKKVDKLTARGEKLSKKWKLAKQVEKEKQEQSKN